MGFLKFLLTLSSALFLMIAGYAAVIYIAGYLFLFLGIMQIVNAASIGSVIIGIIKVLISHEVALQILKFTYFNITTLTGVERCKGVLKDGDTFLSLLGNILLIALLVCMI